MGSILTVTARGRVTLRRELLEHLGVVPGDKIAVELLPSARTEIRAAKLQSSIGDFIGFLAEPCMLSIGGDARLPIAGG